MTKIFINTDGGSRGNPGPMAIGITFSAADGKVLHTHKEYIGEGTNNEAEYIALIRACEILSRSKWYREQNGNGGEATFRLDSKLVVEQVKGNFKIKEVRLKELFDRFVSCTREYKIKVNFLHVPRGENKEADHLVNEALDEKIKSTQS